MSGPVFFFWSVQVNIVKTTSYKKISKKARDFLDFWEKNVIFVIERDNKVFNIFYEFGQGSRDVPLVFFYAVQFRCR